MKNHIGYRPEICHGDGAVVCLRVISSFAWLDSAFIGKDAKLSATFLSGEGLAKSVTEKFIHTAMTQSVASFAEHGSAPCTIFAAVIAAEISP